MRVSTQFRYNLEDEAAKLGISVEELMERHVNELVAATSPAALNLPPEHRWEEDEDEQSSS